MNVKGERRDVPVGTGTAIISTAAAAAAAVSGVTRWTVRGGGSWQLPGRSRRGDLYKIASPKIFFMKSYRPQNGFCVFVFMYKRIVPMWCVQFCGKSAGCHFTDCRKS